MRAQLAFEAQIPAEVTAMERLDAAPAKIKAFMADLLLFDAQPAGFWCSSLSYAELRADFLAELRAQRRAQRALEAHTVCV